MCSGGRGEAARVSARTSTREDSFSRCCPGGGRDRETGGGGGRRGPECAPLLPAATRAGETGLAAAPPGLGDAGCGPRAEPRGTWRARAGRRVTVQGPGPQQAGTTWLPGLKLPVAELTSPRGGRVEG